MNIKPEQIPAEVVEAALAGWDEMRGHPREDKCMRVALAAAMAVLLGGPVGWMRRSITYKDTDGRRDGERILSERKVFCDDISLYAFPTQDTSNEQ